MSNDNKQPNYNLRSRRTCSGTSEGFIRASELLRRSDEERGDSVVHQASSNQQEEPNQSQELVPDLPSNDDNQGGGQRETKDAALSNEDGNQGIPDCSGNAQGQQSSPAHSPLDEQAAPDNTEVLRLRVQVRNQRTHTVEYVWVPINMLI